MSAHIRRIAVCAAALALLSLTGCYATEEGPERSVIRFNGVSRLLMLAVPLAIIVAALALAFFIELTSIRIAVALGIVGVMAFTALIVPGMYTDAVVITPTEISHPTGLWFKRKPRGFRYADVRSVIIRDAPEGKVKKRVWMLHKTNGATEEISPGDLWNFNEEFVVRKLRGYGVAIEAR